MGWLKRYFGRSATRNDAGPAAVGKDATLERAHQEEKNGRYEEAARIYRAAIASSGGDAELWYGLGFVLSRLQQGEAAIEAYRKGLALKPDHARMRNDLALVLMGQQRFEEARAELGAALAAAPDLPAVHGNFGVLCHQLGDLDEAIEHFRRAHRLAPGDADIHGNLLLMLNYSAALPPAEIYAEHRRFGALHVQAVVPPQPERAWPRRLRVGYVSPDFRSHVVSSFMLPILERHDRTAFEVYCYYTYPAADHFSARIKSLADHWIACAALGPAALAARIRADRIDILVDLAGHTAHQRLEAFALRPAPVQMTYLGYPNTTGLDAIDYRLTDALADPPGESDAQHVERLLRLPRCFLCYRPGGDRPDVVPAPCAATGTVTFGSFNNFQKLSPPFFAAVARILAGVPGSRLLLKARPLSSQAIARRVHERFRAAGIDPSRIELLGWEATPENHLAAYQRVDIALDSFPYNGTTTTCEALWMGVPVVGLRGDRHAARVGATLLHAVALDELVADDVDGYVRIARSLAGDRGRLEGLRAGMRARLRTSALRDEEGFVRGLEDAYRTAWQEKLAEAAAPAPDLGALTALWNRGYESGEHADSIDALARAVAGRENDAQLRYMLACTQEALGRHSDAVHSYQRVLELDPSHAKAANNLGCVYEAQGRREEAAASYDRALRADPGLGEALYNRANLRRLRGDLAGAEADLRSAAERGPGRAEWLCTLGEVLQLQWKLDLAEGRHRAALAADPGLARAHFGLGNVLVALGRCEEAEAALRRALELQPDLSEAHSNLLLYLHYHRGDDGARLAEEHRDWARRHAGDLQDASALVAYDRSPGRRLNVGYVSPDFRRHSVATFFEPLLGAHDRARVRVHCFSTGTVADAVTARIKAGCDAWHELHGMSEDAAARLILGQRIDVLVDLAGHSGGGRPLLFARRPAPVQATWLGYPNTTGLSAVQYRITDARADPPGLTDGLHTESLVRLANGFLCYATEAGAPAPGEPPARSGTITFGCFNNLAKASPAVLALWAQVLHAVPGSRLMMKAHGLGAESARRRITAAFADRGIPAGRLRLLGAEDRPQDHLARYREVDIALDTYPYHGTTTTCEALWMGVPVVSLAGPTHVSRVGASLLAQVGLEDLVAGDAQAYVAKAAGLAADCGRLSALRGSLRERMLRAPLMDAKAFAHALEEAYAGMWQRWAGGAQSRAGEPAEAMRLHIGGREAREGWKILDAEARPEVDFVGDAADLSRFADGTVHEIYASHVVEHLGYQRALPRALAEMHRVLRAGGAAKISVPDFEFVCRRFVDPQSSPDQRFHLMRIAFGGQMDEHDFHRVGLTFEFLRGFLYGAGFTRVERVRDFGLFDDTSRLEMDGERVSLNVVAFK